MAIFMNCKSCSAITTINTQPNLLLIFLFVLTTFSWNSVSFFAAAVDQVSYADHCASIVPESTPKPLAGAGYFFNHQIGYYTGGGSGILNPNSPYRLNSILFNTWNITETNVQGLFKLQANLQFESARTLYYLGDSTSSRPQYPGGIYNYKDSGSNQYKRRSIEFLLDGFWSASSGKVCMVGSGIGNYLNEPNSLQNLYVVLKLYNLMNSTSITSLTSGTLESLSKNDPNNFEPVSILMLPRMNYQYTLVSNKSDNSFPGTGSDDPKSSLQIQTFCSTLSRKVLDYDFDLKYSSHCISAKSCIPFVASDVPHIVSLKPIECFEDTRRLRVLVKFSDSGTVWYQRSFDPNTALVGEGAWDAKNNQLFLVACQFLDAAGSWNNTHVGDCSTRLNLRFPAIWTIGNTSGVVGQIWSKKAVTESGYFEKITFESNQNERRRILLPGQKYEYTQIEKVTKLCPILKTGANANNKPNTYPNPFSYDMRFDMSAKNSRGVVSWGSSVPLSVGSQFYHQNWYAMRNSNSVASTEGYSVDSVSAHVSYSYNHRITYNISYKISIKLISYAKLGNTSTVHEVQISAEGIYDETEGSLCMVGCRNLGSNNVQPTTDSVDCEIVVNFQFPPANSSGFIKGSIESTRKKSDPHYFEHLDLSSAASYVDEAKRSIWWIDVEISLAHISTTLACIFVALQLFHVKRHPDVLPSISIFMLLILTLADMVPLMVNDEAMLTNNTNHRKVFLGRGGGLEVNGVIVRTITMVGFLLKLRLLSLTWLAKAMNNGPQNKLWVMEKKAFIVALPVYVAGALAALLLMNWRKIGTKSDVPVISGYQEHRLLGALKSYAGLVLDGFLLPQILLNMFCKSKKNALSVWFYIGTTFVRVLPHAYDLYRAQNSAHHPLNESYIYASPVADFYSTAWDVIIPFGGLLFAGIIYLQQKFGGLCILPQKLRELGEYEKLPTVTEG
ncbi:uncharacterized protein LOC18779614 [Prunus persica]|nr:uncharacterized protein LOC18779614 [Prunus persica]